MSRSTNPSLSSLLSTPGNATNSRRTRTLAFVPLSFDAGRSQMLRALPAPSPSETPKSAATSETLKSRENGEAARRTVLRSCVVVASRASELEFEPERLGTRTLVGMPTPGADAATGVSPLSPRTVVLVQRSWTQLLPISDLVAALFYERLFELDPSLRRLCQGDLGAHKKDLVQMLAVVVGELNNPGNLIPTLQALGARHAGAVPEPSPSYERVGEALLWTLREGLRGAFTKDVEEAWTQVCTLVSAVMRQAATSGSGVRMAPPLQLLGGIKRQPAKLYADRSLEWASACEPPRATAPVGLSGLSSGPLMALLCVVASVGSTLLLALMSSRAEGAMSASALYGVPLLLLVLVFVAFGLGRLTSRRGTPGGRIDGATHVKQG